MANFRKLLQWAIVLALLVALLSACSASKTPAVPTSTPTPTAGASQSKFDDPFDYCAAVGTIDAPDARYTGPEVPEAIIKGLRKKLDMPDDVPTEWVSQGTVWRCMDGKVWACFVGANIPCTAKANTSQTPTSEMVDFCKEQPNAEVIPASVTGHETVYEWRCEDGTPKIVRQVFETDARGFIADFWYEISPGDGS